MPTVQEPAVPILEIIEPEPNREGVSRLRFRFQNHRFRFRFRTGDFLAVFHGSEPSIFCEFCGSGLISRFFGGFSRFRHGFGSKNFEPEPNHGSKIDGFGSDKFSRFRFGTVTNSYSFNRRFDKP